MLVFWIECVCKKKTIACCWPLAAVSFYCVFCWFGAVLSTGAALCPGCACMYLADLAKLGKSGMVRVVQACLYVVGWGG